MLITKLNSGLLNEKRNAKTNIIDKIKLDDYFRKKIKVLSKIKSHDTLQPNLKEKRKKIEQRTSTTDLNKMKKEIPIKRTHFKNLISFSENKRKINSGNNFFVITHKLGKNQSNFICQSEDHQEIKETIQNFISSKKRLALTGKNRLLVPYCPKFCLSMIK